MNANGKPMPQIFVARRVIDKIGRGALLHGEEETGEALIGVSVPRPDQKLPRIYVLDTIAPIDDVVREWAMFEQGDDWQGAIFNWWHDNWELYRKLRRGSYGNAMAGKWDFPLVHLGDWHKQPGGMIDPSRGDFRTARRFMRDLELDYLLTPIVTLADDVTAPRQTNTIEIATALAKIRIDFWWLGRRGNAFEPVEPVVKPNAFFPRLPPIAWWLADRNRFDEELAALERDGLQVLDIATWNTRGHPPLETCLTIYRPGARSVFIAATPVNYPQRSPNWRVAPIMRPQEGQDLFGLLYHASNEIPPDTVPNWSPEHHLLDGVKAIEAWEKARG